MSKKAVGRQEGHPLKGLSREKTPLLSKKCPHFSIGPNVRTSTMSFSPTRSAPVSSVSLVLGQPCLRPRADADPHQSPIRIKTFVLYAQCLKHGPCPLRSYGPRKSSVPCRVQLDVLQISWFLANPFVAHDIGESGRTMTTAQNSVDYVGAAATNHILWISTNPHTGSLLPPN